MARYTAEDYDHLVVVFSNALRRGERIPQAEDYAYTTALRVGYKPRWRDDAEHLRVLADNALRQARIMHNPSNGG